MRDILRRLKSADANLGAELIGRGAFSKSEVKELMQSLAKEKPRAKERATLERMGRKRAMIQTAARYILAGLPFPKWALSPGFIPALAHGDRQLAIHAVINCPISDQELAQLSKLTALQTQGHLLRQLRVAIEIETNKRKTHGYRAGGNRVATKRG